MADAVELTESERRTIRALYPILVAQRDAMNRAIEVMKELDALNAAAAVAQATCAQVIADAEGRALSVRAHDSNGETR